MSPVKSKNKHKQPQKIIVNTLINYKPIFSYNKRKQTDILYLKKQEFDIFYSCKYKYPLLIKESITVNTGQPGANETRIDRRLVIDPFREDPDIPSKYRHTLTDYETYMAYGGSMGHNAPAGQHLTNMSIWSETFLLSNISPQEIVLNTGLWALLENWCKNLGRNNKLYNITIFTGNIPNMKFNKFKGLYGDVVMNVPVKMFKIVCFNHVDYPSKLFMDIFITNNEPYYINPNFTKCNLAPYLVPEKSREWFQNFTGINLLALLKFYNLIDTNLNGIADLEPTQNVIHPYIFLNHSLQLLMKKSNWFGRLVYVDSLEELERNWTDCQTHETEFGTLEFHQSYYDLSRQRLSPDNKTYDKLIMAIEKKNYRLDSIKGKSIKGKSIKSKHIKTRVKQDNFTSKKNNKTMKK